MKLAMITCTMYLRICSFAISVIFALITLKGYSQTLEGPQNPPPKLSSITYDHNPNEGWIGRPGGILYTVTNITLANTTRVYWSMLSDSIKLSMDGNGFTSDEVLDFNTVASNPAVGILIWSGSTSIPIAGGSPRPLLSKFIVTVVDQNDNPLSLIRPDSIGLPANAGGALSITGNTMVFKIRIEMLVSDNGGTTYVPHLDYYDAAPTPIEAISAFSSYSHGFYWKNDPPEIEIALALHVDEGDTATISNSIVKAVDVESTPSNIIFIIQAAENGKLRKGNSDLAPGDTFNMDDINKGLIKYIHNGAETTDELISFIIADEDGQLFREGEDSLFYLTVNVTPTDDPPSLAINGGMTMNEGESQAVNDVMLLTTDPESDSSLVTYTLDPAGDSNFPGHGLLKLNGTPLSDGGTFTQADIEKGLLVYKHDGSETIHDSFVFQVTDQYGHLARVAGNHVFTFEINILPVNDPPVLVTNEGLTLNEGDTMVVDEGMLQATDIENTSITYMLDPEGNSDLPGHGVLRLDGVPLNDGDSFTQADILGGLLTYQHDGSESLLDGFVFHVEDENGTLASDNGNSIFIFNISVTPVNDPPVLVLNEGMTLNEGDTMVVDEGMLRATDVESDSITYVLDPEGNSDLPGHGVLRLDGVPLNDGDTFTQADILGGLLTYQHDGSEDLQDGFVFHIEDEYGMLANDNGNSIFSFEISITQVNDPPVLILNTGMTLNEGETRALEDEMLSATDPESLSTIYRLDPDGNSDLPGHGLLMLNGTLLNDGDTFTQADILEGRLAYQHDGTENLLDGFVFHVEDENGMLASDNGNSIFFFEISINAVNDLPVLTKNYPLTVDQGTEVTISNSYLAASDEESNAEELTFTLDPNLDVQQPAGTLALNGVVLTDGQSFTMADINDSLITYLFSGNSGTSDFFAFTITDANGGVANDGGFTLFHFNFTIVQPTGLQDGNSTGHALFRSFPNPVNDLLHIILIDGPDGVVNLSLFTGTGVEIWQKKEDKGEEIIIPFSAFPAGVYYLVVEKNKVIQTEKLIRK